MILVLDYPNASTFDEVRIDGHSQIARKQRDTSSRSS